MVYLDKLDHASIVDGAKMSYGETERFNHGDLANLERRMERNGSSKGSMIVVDGVYSMEGNIADVPGAGAGSRGSTARPWRSTTRTPSACWDRTATAPRPTSA